MIIKKEKDQGRHISKKRLDTLNTTGSSIRKDWLWTERMKIQICNDKSCTKKRVIINLFEQNVKKLSKEENFGRGLTSYSSATIHRL